jgi:hypothetical protein
MTTVDQQIAANIRACQQMANETSSRLRIDYSPSGVWFARCGLYSQEGSTLNEVLTNLLLQRQRFNANPPIEEVRQ